MAMDESKKIGAITMYDWIERLAELHRTNTSAALVTLIRTSGSTPRKPGAKMLVESNGAITGTIGGGSLEKNLIAKALTVLSNQENSASLHNLAEEGQQCGGAVECFIEVLNGGPRLYLFGAGHVGLAVCRVLAGTDFRIHLIDDRIEQLQSPEIPSQVLCHQGLETFSADFVGDDKNCYAAIFTHSHELDYALVRQLARKPLRYLGLIGSQSKWKRMRQQLHDDGLSEKELCRITCPIGKKIGNGPIEVAVSLAAELLDIHHNR